MRLWFWLVAFVLSMFYMVSDPGETGEPMWWTVTLAAVASIIVATVAAGAVGMAWDAIARRLRR
jgi:hypothetical protein